MSAKQSQEDTCCRGNGADRRRTSDITDCTTGAAENYLRTKKEKMGHLLNVYV